MITPATFISILEQLRIHSGKTVTEFCEQLGIGRQTWYNFFQNQNIQVDTLCNLLNNAAPHSNLTAVLLHQTFAIETPFDVETHHHLLQQNECAVMMYEQYQAGNSTTDIAISFNCRVDVVTQNILRGIALLEAQEQVILPPPRTQKLYYQQLRLLQPVR